MATVLCISSFVARGHVGLTAIVPALQGLGHDTIALPTVLLSNHPGHDRHSKHAMPAETINAAVEVYRQAGWLADIAAVLTGYLPAAGHVAAAVTAIRSVRLANPNVLVVCDPVCGDDPGGLYIDTAAANAMRETLLPLANCVTPNRFELEWLSGRRVDTAESAIEAARTLDVPRVLTTSLPLGAKALGNVLVEKTSHAMTTVALLSHVPHGSGDYMAALFTGYMLSGETAQRALQLATAAVETVCRRSVGCDELRVSSVQLAPITPSAGSV